MICLLLFLWSCNTRKAQQTPELVQVKDAAFLAAELLGAKALERSRPRTLGVMVGESSLPALSSTPDTPHVLVCVQRADLSDSLWVTAL